MTPRPADDLDLERLARYFAGECPPPEVDAIRAWIAADETRQARVELLHRAWQASGSVELRGDLDRSWSVVSAKLDATDAPASSSRVLHLRPPPTARSSRRAWSRAAAMLLAVALGAALAREVGWRKPAVAARATHVAEMREVTTKRGQHANAYLSDGTLVVLSAGSTLRFPTAFDSSRDVDLNGEAYFEVAHDTARSFVVHTQYGTVRDLGTKFGVRAYRDIAAATVTVTEGSVLLKPTNKPASRTANTDSLVLGPKDVARISMDRQLSVRRGVRTDQNLAWVGGRLVFDRMPVPEAIAQINRWYDVNVQLGDSTLARFALTASLSTEPFARAIQIIAAALDARIERRGSTVLLFPARGRS
jgi:transmembrane sensor